MAIACVLLLPFAFSTVGAMTGTIRGRVIDKATREPLVGANVSVVHLAYGTATDAEGSFVLQNVPAGQQELRTTMIGFRTVLTRNVQVRPNLTTTLTVEMDHTEIQIDEVVVTLERPPLQKDITGTTHFVSAKDITLMPITTFEQAIGMQAGVTAEGNFRGGRATEVLYMVDGLPLQNTLHGGLLTTLPTSSIVEMAVQTGGFDAEFGNALSGIVNVVTRTGSTPRASVLASSDYVYGGTQNNQESYAEAAVGGPLAGESMTGFLSLLYQGTGTRWWQDFQHISSMPVDANWVGFGRLDFKLAQGMRLSIDALGSARSWRDYEFSWRFNLPGLPERSQSTLRGTATFSHNVTPSTFYTLRLSHQYVDDQIGPEDPPGFDPLAIYQYDFYLRFVMSGERSLWSSSQQNVTMLRGDVSSRLSEIVTVKAGGELNLNGLAVELEKYEPQKTYFGKPLIAADPLNYSTSYDYHPKTAAAFAQAKVETKDGLVISAGLRYDVLDPGASRPAIESIPLQNGQYATSVTDEVPASVKQQLSPRFGLTMPLTPQFSFFVNYGHYVQFPLFEYLYSGLDVVRYQRGAVAVLGNPDLEPERTKAWEISLRYVLPMDIVASLTHFNKETTNQIDSKTFLPFNAKASGDYGYAEYVNLARAEASGFEFIFRRDRGEVVTGEVSYTYMKAEGMSDRVSQGMDLAQWGFETSPTLFPMSWDQRHTVKANLAFHLPFAIDASVYVEAHSARPYTYYPSRDGFTAVDTSMPFVPNNERMDSYASLDMKIQKAFDIPIGGGARLILFVDGRNLFNTMNVRWVDSSGRIGGELRDPGAYYTGRRVRIGLQFEMRI